MKYSECKEIINEYGREALEDITLEIPDFEVDNHRFIHRDYIDEIQQEELSSDPYILGCFNSWFLASVLDIDEDVIQSMQNSEAFEAIGKLVLSLDKLEELQSEYAGADGYGHHFNHWDGGEEEIGDYFVFRTI